MSASTDYKGPQPQIELLNAEIPRTDVRAEEEPTVRQVNWTMCNGDFWVIAAPPGAGKTDLLTTAAGLQRPAEGELILFGYPTRGATEKDLLPHRRRIGLVLEAGGRLFNELTVAENVTLPICYHSNCRPDSASEQAARYLEPAGLLPHADAFPTEIHRNLRPRIALARALALEPEVLLLDNPLAGLDPRQARWWLEFLSALVKGHSSFNRRRISVAVTTDDLRPWLEFGGRFALLKQRRWVELGSRADVERSEDQFVKEMLGTYSD
ncbi:MAG TPA: ATP-binding cassette domain-containing protein [Methylomirabilota bacterium]|nr:ATP-binding cassette domain-containing protein [Methylomirabilota bacterium]